MKNYVILTYCQALYVIKQQADPMMHADCKVSWISPKQTLSSSRITGKLFVTPETRWLGDGRNRQDKVAGRAEKIT